MKMVEMFIDDTDIESGINAISVVENPAIESDFVTLQAEKQIELAEIDKEQRLLLGAALIPDKPILRRDDNEEEYYVYFSKTTVRQAAELFAKRKFQDRATQGHSKIINGMTVVESWLVMHKEKDKSAYYNLDLPIGSWCIAMKADNDEVYNLAKQGEIKGFSIEGLFSSADDNRISKVETEINEVLQELGYIELESYSDYPKSATNNAKRALDYVDENGWGDCGTPVGKRRANQLAKGKNISEDTVKRMAAFARHEQHKDVPYTDGCGGLMWDCWGGSSGINWAKSKIKKIEDE